MKEDPSPSKTQTLRILLVTLFIILIITVILDRDFQKIKTFIQNSGYLGIAISILLYGVMGATVIPSEPLTVLNGILFGPFTATLIAGTGNTLAALVEYYIGIKLADASNFAERKKHLPFGLSKIPLDSAVFLLGGRMVPAAGPKMVSVLSGVYRVPLYRYLWTTALATFVGAAIFAYGGFGLFHLIR